MNTATAPRQTAIVTQTSSAGKSESRPSSARNPRGAAPALAPVGDGQSIRDDLRCIAVPDLSGIAFRRYLLDVEEREAVAAARAGGWSWRQIGDALGITRQAAHLKHGRGSK